MRSSFFPLGLASALLAASAADAGQVLETPGRKAGDVVLEPASVTVAGVGKVDFELGTLFVPENRAEKNSRLIGVGFARFPAETKSTEPQNPVPPIFMLPGGPGSSFLTSLKSGNPSPGLVKQILRYRAAGDVVLVDQRGFSERGDVLMYRYRSPDEPLVQPASLERSTKAYAAKVRAAVAEFDAKKIDLRGYTVKECADDVDELRRALGYDRLMLVGVSFGSQWSFAVMRRHPDRVARALLSGVEPLDCGYDMPSHILAAVQRMWWEAEQDERFKPFLPPGGVAAAAREVLKRLEREPIRVPLKGVKHPETGDTVIVTLGHEDLQRSPTLRAPEGPAFVLSLYHGHYDRWAFETNLMRRSRNVEFPVIGALIDTSLGVTPARRYLLENDPAAAVLGQWNFHGYLATADLWPTPDVGDDFRTEIPCSIPVVFVHGDWDVQTPIENALQVAPYFPNGRVLVVERGGHGALNQVAQQHPKTFDALIEFLKTGETKDIPPRVTLPAPRFPAPNFPPPADLDTAFQLLEQAVADGQVPGVVALVSRDGRIVREAAFGLRDLENKRPFRTDTICWLASITKPMTVAAAMKLVEDGKLGLDDPVEKYLPEFKEQTAPDGRHYPVTIRQLMSHTSGITARRPPLRPTLFFETEWLGRSLAEIPPEIAKTSLEFKPGEKVQYSNAAPYVLGRIVEIVSGRPFGEYVRDVIFRPLGMNDTFFAIPASHAERMAVVYRKVEGRRETFCRFDPAWKMTMAMPDGGLFSTTGDVAKFVQAFLDDDGKILTAPSVKQMLTEQAPGWGLGWSLADDGVFRHDGSSGTSAWADPKTGMVGVVFCQIQDREVVDALQDPFREAVRAAAR